MLTKVPFHRALMFENIHTISINYSVGHYSITINKCLLPQSDILSLQEITLIF